MTSSWDAPSKTEALRKRNSNTRPQPNDRSPLDSVDIGHLAFGDNNNNNSIARNNNNITNGNNKKRYVARIKNVCLAIPFDPNQTLLQFQKEAIMRASSHRKLKKQSKLSNRIQYIKLATPHFPQLVDVCYIHHHPKSHHQHNIINQFVCDYFSVLSTGSIMRNCDRI